ncbi:MAG: hypothetical protein WD810_08555 [Solirubrobacterales bacterium]
MAHEDYAAAAQELIGPGESVEAAGVFGLQDDYKGIALGGVATSIAMPDKAAPGLAGLGAAASIEMSRRKNAEAQGVSVRMLVAVTDRSIHLMSMHAVGGDPRELLMSFDRADTEVEVSRFGLSKRLKLTDPKSGQHIGLTGNTARFAYGAKGDKTVFDALGAS